MYKQLRTLAREGAAALLRLAKTTSNPDVAARFVQRAADLKEHADDLPEDDLPEIDPAEIAEIPPDGSKES